MSVNRDRGHYERIETPTGHGTMVVRHVWREAEPPVIDQDHANTGIATHHLAMLAASDIPLEHAQARGYETVTDPRRLAELKIVKAAQDCVPGLLIPLLRVDGSTWGYQYRPDSPRLRDGKPVKYETPWQQRNGIDVPPTVGDYLHDPTVPLWITEGSKKADCGAQYGLCIVALLGVWNWRGTNGAGGTTVVPDFNDIALNGRRVILAYDGDVARKASVAKAICGLADYLKSRDAKVEYLHLPDTDDKTGLDDYLVADHTIDDLWRLVKPNQPPLREDRKAPPAESAAAPVPVAEPEPEGPPVAGAELLDDLVAWFERFIFMPDPQDYEVLALWVVHTHMVSELYTTGRLQIDSVVPESGKTTVLEHLGHLCFSPVHAASIGSSAVLVRLLRDAPRTLLLDEIDRTLNPDRPGVDELIAVLNSGYKVGSMRPVNVPDGSGGWVVEEMSTFAPVAMAGNSPRLPDDTRSRSIRVLLLPILDDSIEDSEWELIKADARALQGRVAAFADQQRADIARDVELPKDCRSRSKEKWKPLKRVAVAAGGEWPDIADALIQRDLDAEAAEREDGLRARPPGFVALQDLFTHWPEEVGDYDIVPTKELVEILTASNPQYWSRNSAYGRELTAQRLGRIIHQASKLTSVRDGATGPRGYRKSQLKRVWRGLGLKP